MHYDVYYEAYKAITDRLEKLQEMTDTFSSNKSQAGINYNPKILESIEAERKLLHRRIDALNDYVDLPDNEFMSKHWNATAKRVLFRE